MIVGVTGASGFIGRQTVQLLKESGHDVRKFVRREVKNDDEIYWSPAKKEIDIDYYKNDDKHSCIELKYVRDKGSYNIGMFSFYEDIKFVEELVESGKFQNGYCILFTSIKELYTPPNKKLNPKNKENIRLYDSFRVKKQLSGTVSIKTGPLNKSISIKGKYNLNILLKAPLLTQI